MQNIMRIVRFMRTGFPNGKISLLCVALLLWLTVSAQGQYRFDYWTADTGLPQNSVLSVRQTSDGYLWFTTLDGLVRFDGISFKVFNKSNSRGLATNRLTRIFMEDDDTLWIATENGGLVRYRKGEFRTFTVADGLPADDVNEIVKDFDGSLLISTRLGLARFRHERFTTESGQDSRDFRIYFSPSGVRWEIDASGLQATKDGRTTKYALPFNAGQISADRTYNYPFFVQMLEDDAGRLWLTADASLYKLENGVWTTFSRKDGMPTNLVYSIGQDKNSELWFGTLGEGLCRFAANKIVCYTTADGLSSNRILYVLFDRENTLWAATNERGINRVTRQIITPLAKKEGLFDSNIYPILQDSKGSLWIGANNALSKYENGKVTNYTRGEGLLYHEVVQSLFEDKDNRLWIGSVGGIEYFENGKFTDFTQKLNLKIGDYDFRAIYRDREGALWFATNKGLFKYEDEAVTHFTTDNGLPGNDITSIVETRSGSLWFATYGGIARFADGRFDSFTEREGLVGNRVRTIFEDEEGALWIGTYDSGLSRFKDGKFTNYTTDNGLFSNGVFQILPDGRGNFWMSCNQGIYRVSRNELKDFADGKIQSITSTAFGKSDGMLSTECNGGRQPAGIKTTDGRLWFPTQDGVAIVNPELIHFNPNPPPVIIENIKIDNKEQPAGPVIEINPNQNNLEIIYTGLSFIKPEQIRFRYKMEGLDAKWTEAGGRRAAYYPYLPPGSYTFRVIAANSDNVWNEQGATIRVVVLPPFYRTWWFALLMVSGMVAIGILLYWRRISELNRKHAIQDAFSRKLIDSQEQERKRFAAEIHDGLGQSLVIIKNRARLSMKQADNKTATLDHLENISATASNAIEEAREMAFNLRPHLLDRLGLTKTIESMLEKVFSAGDVRLETELDFIDDVFEKESEILFYRIVQECASNVVKHARASEAKVSIERDERNLTLTVSDNGRGFDTSANGRDLQKRSFGLVGIAERTRLLGGKQKIESEAGKGTTFKIFIDMDNRKA